MIGCHSIKTHEMKNARAHTHTCARTHTHTHTHMRARVRSCAVFDRCNHLPVARRGSERSVQRSRVPRKRSVCVSVLALHCWVTAIRVEGKHVHRPTTRERDRESVVPVVGKGPQPVGVVRTVRVLDLRQTSADVACSSRTRGGEESGSGCMSINSKSSTRDTNAYSC